MGDEAENDPKRDGALEERHSVVMSDIDAQGLIEENVATAAVVDQDEQERVSIVKAKVTKSKLPAKPGVFDLKRNSDGTLEDIWDPRLPRPPSLRDVVQEERSNAEQVAVFGANTQEGSTMVRILSQKGMRVVAAVRVFTSKKTKELIKLKGVTVKVADTNDEKSLLAVAKGCVRAFIVTKYWEKFDSGLEEIMALNVLNSCGKVSPPIQNLVCSTFEDCTALALRGRKSQITPTRDGRIFPNFDGKSKLDDRARELGVMVTHMMTSYYDEADNRKSLILIRGLNKRLIVNSFIEGLNLGEPNDGNNKPMM